MISPNPTEIALSLNHRDCSPVSGSQPNVVPGGRPPETRMFAPATYDAASEQSQQTVLAISSGVPMRPRGIWLKSKVFAVSATMSVSVIPGETVLMRTPTAPSGLTSPIVIEFKAPFVMLYSSGEPMYAEPDEICTMLPASHHPCAKPQVASSRGAGE